MHSTNRRSLIALAAAFSVIVAGVIVSPAYAHDPPLLPEPEDRFQKVLLEDQGLTQPMRLAPADDGRVVYIERDGRVKVWDPDTTATVTAGTVPVRVTGELGLVGLALAPDFSESGQIYVHFSRPDWPQSFISRVSRFVLSDENVLDLASEQVIIDIQHPLGVGGGHSAGDLLASEDGYLFIATGDNTSCCASRGFPGTDERPGQANGDAQRTSANTNDLNGKILRIVPGAEGGYTSPEDNLFPESADSGNKTRPEIYAMGFRNPFTIGDWDAETKTLWMADYGPDAVLADPQRGPAGHVNMSLIRKPGFFGWPYCTMNAVPYNDWNYFEDKPGAWFDCDKPINDSPNNTGLVELPPVTPADIYYTYSQQEYFPELYGGGAMAGPRYVYNEDNPSKTKFPEWFDGRHFLFDWTTDWVHTTRFSHHDPVVATDMRAFLPDGDFRKPMDMAFGADGSLYVLEYGNGWGASNDDSGIYRIDYVEGNRSPSAIVTTSADSGALPLKVTFDAAGSTDPDGDALSVAWDFDGDGTTDATGATATHTFTQAGEHAVRATVTDPEGATAASTVHIVAGNTRPTVKIVAPHDGGFAEFGADLPFKIEVTDPEDGVVDCTKVVVSYQLGHNTHGHPMGETVTADANCEGVLKPGRDASHGPGAYVFHAIEASYTDSATQGAPALTGTDGTVLHPRQLEARTYPSGQGVGLYTGQLFVPGSGDWFSFPTFSMRGVASVDIEVATRLPGANVTIRAGSPDGPIVANLADIPSTGSTALNARAYKTFEVPVTDPGGVNDLYFVGTWQGEVQPELFIRNVWFKTVATEPTTTIAGVPSPRFQFGAPITITATVDGAYGTPTGQVSVADSAGQILGSGSLTAGEASIKLDQPLPAGAHALTVTYAGDGTFKTSTSSKVRLTVASAHSDVEAQVTPNLVEPGAAPLLSVRVTTSTGVAPTGSVKASVLRGSNVLGSATGTLDSEGKVTITLPKQAAVGTYSVRIQYLGDANIHKSIVFVDYIVKG